MVLQNSNEEIFVHKKRAHSPALKRKFIDLQHFQYDRAALCENSLMSLNMKALQKFASYKKLTSYVMQAYMIMWSIYM